MHRFDLIKLNLTLSLCDHNWIIVFSKLNRIIPMHPNLIHNTYTVIIMIAHYFSFIYLFTHYTIKRWALCSLMSNDNKTWDCSVLKLSKINLRKHSWSSEDRITQCSTLQSGSWSDTTQLNVLHCRQKIPRFSLNYVLKVLLHSLQYAEHNEMLIANY